MKILVAIFHKDRINYLDNLLNSIDKFLPTKSNNFKFIIFDNSENNSSKTYLKKINKKFQIISNVKNRQNNIKNLYLSMNKSLRIAKEELFDYILTLQEDMQIVSNITGKDFKKITKIFEDKNVLCINPTFFRKIDCVNFKNVHLSKKKNYYIYDGTSYADCAIFSVKKLLKINFNFKSGEDKIDKKYIKKYYLAYLINPFVHFLPWSESSRKSRFDKFYITKFIKKILVKINSIGLSAGVNPIYLSITKNKFLNRNNQIIPTDEVYLKCNNKLKLPWAYDPYWSLKKYQSVYNLFSLNWIFGGSLDYQKSYKNLKYNNLIDKKIFFCR